MILSGADHRAGWRQQIAVRWRALNRSCVAHAFVGRSSTQPALCGMFNQEERHDWPRQSRCDECMRQLNEKAG